MKMRKIKQLCVYTRERAIWLHLHTVHGWMDMSPQDYDTVWAELEYLEAAAKGWKTNIAQYDNLDQFARAGAEFLMQAMLVLAYGPQSSQFLLRLAKTAQLCDNVGVVKCFVGECLARGWVPASAQRQCLQLLADPSTQTNDLCMWAWRTRPRFNRYVG